MSEEDVIYGTDPAEQERVSFETVAVVGKYVQGNGNEVRIDLIRASTGAMTMNMRSWWEGNDGVWRPSRFPLKGIPLDELEKFKKLVVRAAKLAKDVLSEPEKSE